MNAFAPGDKVLFHNSYGHCRIGTVTKPYGSGWIISLLEDACGPGGWFASPSSLTKIPDGVPIYCTGTRVQVPANAPFHPGARGTINALQICDGIFGYWLDLDGADEPAWVAAEALDDLVPDGGEPR